MSLFLIDSSVLIAHLRGYPAITHLLVELLARGHDLSTSAVNVAEIEAGLRDRERNLCEVLLDRLIFLPTDREAGHRAGRYQRELRLSGRTLHTPDALIAGTARRHGAVLMTHNRRDFPMDDIEVVSP